MPLSKNVLSGLIFVILGIVLCINSMLLGYNTLRNMGPGVFPGAIGLLMLLIGGGVLLRGLQEDDDNQEISFNWRPLVFITLGVLLFSIILRPLGMVLSLMILIVIARFAGDDIKPKQLAIQAVALTAITVLIFHYGLEIPLNLWPR